MVEGKEKKPALSMNRRWWGEKKKTALILAFSPRRRNRCSRIWSI